MTVKETVEKPLLAQMSPRALYVHIPFCASKCFYCDFTSYVTGAPARTAYTGQLAAELRMLRDEFFGHVERPRLDTVFFGGGTPTLLTVAELEILGATLHQLFDLSADVEWTVEANPGSVTIEQLQCLREFGVNRLSFGAQTLNDTLLQAIGRLHLAQDVERSLELAHTAGFNRVNLDLMLGLPDQTMADLRESVAFVGDSGIEHVSAYGLKIEANTPFAKWEEAGLLRLPDEDAQADLYEEVRAEFGRLGYEQYEISNFSRPGGESRHNLGYWSNLPYLAAGAGAHGYVYGVRYENERSLAAYGRAVTSGARPVALRRAVSSAEAMEDTLMLGLRLQNGVSRVHFANLHGESLDERFAEPIRRLVSLGVLDDDGDRVAVPRRHYGIANEIFAEFIGVCS